MGSFGYRHIIWDWNGTLFDDAWLCVDIINGMLARRNLPAITPEIYESIFAFPVIDYYRKAGFDFSVEPFERLSDEFMGTYSRRMLECQLRQGARQVLESGREKGLTQSILSAMKQEHLDGALAHFGLRDCFTDVLGLEDHHAAGKIEIAQQWIAGQANQRRHILLIGDTTHDHEVAEALGVDCWHIHSGHHAQERLAASGARLLGSLLELYR